MRLLLGRISQGLATLNHISLTSFKAFGVSKIQNSLPSSESCHCGWPSVPHVPPDELIFFDRAPKCTYVYIEEILSFLGKLEFQVLLKAVFSQAVSGYRVANGLTHRCSLHWVWRGIICGEPPEPALRFFPPGTGVFIQLSPNHSLPSLEPSEPPRRDGCLSIRHNPYLSTV